MSNTVAMQPTQKRTIQINLRLTDGDSLLLMKAAEKRWPGAELSQPGVIPSLAKLAARDILGQAD